MPVQKKRTCKHTRMEKIMTNKLSTILSAAVLSTGITLGSADDAEAAQTVSICNNKDENVFVTLGWHDYAVPTATGWQRVEPNTCETIQLPNADIIFPIYGYGVTQSGQIVSPSTTRSAGEFCINLSHNFNVFIFECAFSPALPPPLHE